ncbi:MAG TPA: kelch repeat-containing protein, partial [bacterium]|nr:kelch repeat-containing protein [bacterium]
MTTRRPFRFLGFTLPALALCAAIAACGGKSSTPLGSVTEPLGVADGTVDAWRALAPMPVPRANHCAAVANGWLVVVGGNHSAGGSFVSTDEIDIARLENGGAIGGWRVAGKAPSPVTECTLAASNGRLWLLDGFYDDTSKQGTVWTATLSPSGALSAWAAAGPIPTGRYFTDSEAWVDSAGLHVFDAQLPADTGGNHVAIVSTPLLAAGTFTALTPVDVVPAWRGRAAYAATDAGRAFVLGGYLDSSQNNATVTDVFAMPVAAASTASTFATSPLPQPRTFGRAVAVDDWIVHVGGRPVLLGANGVPDVYAAQVNGTGGLGAFTSQSALPEGRTNFAMALAGNWLYVTGGGFDAGGLDTVFVARVRH